MNYRTLGALLLIASLLVTATVAYHNNQRSREPIIFSSKEVLSSLWSNYKKTYVDVSGCTVDPSRENATTSEGQSYTMLRAVWSDDKDTFDLSWQCAKTKLQKPNALFAWLYGKTPQGNYGVRTDIGGNNAASDADSDIALALLFAYERWGDSTYLSAARPIIQSIWNNEVISIKGVPYLAANDLEKRETDTVVVNPSYFAPYSYRIFATMDPAHNWSGLVDSSYEVLRVSMADGLDKNHTVGLPPDWVLIDPQSGEIKPGNVGTLTTNYSFDAMRIPWRIALDWQWNEDPRAKETLSEMEFLQKQWSSQKELVAGYTHDGSQALDFEAPAMYGTSIGYFLTTNAHQATSLYNAKLKTLYDPDHYSWRQPLGYYDDNWAWFGLAMYYHSLPNLAEGLVGPQHTNIGLSRP
ncbi:hypothetical protein KW791_00970 [Candidatus Parcubacteria bacterium]|nr:hypothetical protein [Candidatus Parcubacteria bacterium]